MQRLITLLLLAGITFTVQAQTNCGLLHDSNANGFVDIEDFLSILGLFGDQDSDGDGLYDSQDNCSDLAACNYSVGNGGCLYSDALGVCGGLCENDADGNGICDWDGCGDPLFYQGYYYDTVLIGNQCWFAENLHSENYENGDTIPSISDIEWQTTTSGAVASGTYGRLYNFHAMEDARGLCPSGWHVPTVVEWEVMTDFLGGQGEAAFAMKATYGWGEDTSWGANGSNTSGFTALPGGYRDITGNLVMDGWGGSGSWWGSSPTGSTPWYIYLNVCDCWEFETHSNGISPNFGFSVRCIAVDSDSDGIWDSQDDCIDLEACNYAASPTEPCAFIDVLGECGGGCEGDGDGDGICDNVDTCVGELDECGVCNGPGPTEVVIDDITIIYDSVFLPLDDDWYVFPISADTTFTYTCAPSFSDCGDPVSYQGYDYATVLIGEQCWFAENLRNENYENGDAIPSSLSDSEWENASSGAVAVYGEGNSTCYDDSPDGDACDAAWSLSEYGRLYNWYAVDDARGLCPSGWHVPTDGEWMTMEMALGMSESEANDIYWRGTDQGTQMKTDYGWTGGGGGSNSSGFLGLPGGFRNSNGFFDYAGDFGYWWSSSPLGSDAWSRFLNNYFENVYRFNYFPQLGFSVRCVQDSEE